MLITLVLLLISGAIGLYLYITRRRLKECVIKQSLIRETESAERRRIAKDIHDELGSGLSKIKFLSELMYTQAGNKQQLDASLRSISETCKNVIDNMRDLVWAMNPENTTLANLVARIREYSGEYLEEFPIDIVYNIPEDIPQTRITKEMSRNIYMIVKEALQNVVKHSKADKVFFVMQLHPHFSLQISDNGTGDINESRKDGNGLKNMESRSKVIGAELSIIATPGNGTRIELKTNISPVNSTT
jgi:signal transduction histidine kinase